MGTLTTNCIFSIGGDDYDDYNFLDIVMTQKLLSPAELRFTMQKKGLTDTIKDGDFPIPKKLMGKEVVCEIATSRFDENDELQEELFFFTGYVVNVHVYRSGDLFSEQLIDVQAFTFDYLLIDHPHCFSYEDMSLNDIVTKTLEPYKIDNKINPRTKGAIPYTVQYNEPNYHFLIRLAKRYGEWMYHDGVKWVFGEIQKKETIKLEPRNDILSYEFKAVLMHHKAKHAHHNYMKYENPAKCDTDFPDLMKPNYHELTDVAKSESASKFTKNTFQHLRCSNPEVNGIDELEVSVKAQLFGEKTQQMVCTGSSIRSDLTIGSIITICDHFYDDDINHKNIEHEELIITSISHSTEVNGHYKNHFTAYPAKSEYPPYYHSDQYPLAAAQRAKVMDNKDPEKLGRIRVQFLWQEAQDASLMTPWIRIAQPYGGDGKGFYFIPEIDEEVMVDFENANAEKPYVVGTLWHGKQHLKDTFFYTDTNDNKVIKTRNGHTLTFCDDHEKKGWIMLYDKWNNMIRIDSDENLIRIQSMGNIELYAKNDISLHAEHDIIQKAEHNRLSTVGGVDDVSSGSHNYVSGSNIHMEAKNTFFAQGEDKAVVNSHSLTQIQSDATTNVLGNGSVFVGSGGEMEVDAGATMNIEAKATMDIKAGAPMTIKGAIVNIN